jgi:hypothetical protein
MYERVAFILFYVSFNIVLAPFIEQIQEKWIVVVS